MTSVGVVESGLADEDAKISESAQVTVSERRARAKSTSKVRTPKKRQKRVRLSVGLTSHAIQAELVLVVPRRRRA